MSFVDAHDFSVDLVLRVLGIPASPITTGGPGRRNPRGALARMPSCWP